LHSGAGEDEENGGKKVELPAGHCCRDIMVTVFVMHMMVLLVRRRLVVASRTPVFVGIRHGFMAFVMVPVIAAVFDYFF